MSTITAVSILDDLERLVVSNEEFVRLEDKLGRFCIFEAMNLVRGEVKIGNLLANFLEPNGSHGFGAKILQTFVMEAVRSGKQFGAPTENLGPMDFYISGLSSSRIYREWKNIDILIEIKEMHVVIAVELKISSKQGNSQLERYRLRVENDPKFVKWKKLYCFLTVENEEPSDQNWMPLRYHTLVPAFERIVVPEANVDARAAFHSLLAMLRRHHVTDDKLEEIARRLWSSHRAALTFLADRRPDGLRGLFATLLQQTPDIAVQISDQNYSFVADASTTGDIRFGCKQWDRFPELRKGEGWTSSGRMLLFELKRFGDTAVAELYLGPGPKDIRSQIVDVIGKFRHRKDLKPGNDWMCVAKQIIYKSSADADIDTELVRAEILEGFKLFCRDRAKMIDQALIDCFSK